MTNGKEDWKENERRNGKEEMNTKGIWGKAS